MAALASKRQTGPISAVADITDAAGLKITVAARRMAMQKGGLPAGDGEGMVQYTLSPLPTLPSGASITNQASIVFDVNAPILTEVVTNTIDATAPVSLLSRGLEETGTTNTVQLTVIGDDASGSGIADILVYVSDDGGPFEVWRNVGAEPLAFAGTLGHCYQLYSAAIDQVGNEEAAPATPGLVLAFPPSLRVGVDATQGKFRLSWAGSTEVQSASSVAGPYEDLGDVATRVEENWVTELEPTAADAYFRLKKE